MADETTGPLAGADSPEMLPLSASTGPSVSPMAAPAPAPTGNPRPWALILKGALDGLAGASQVRGRGGFGAGAAAGAENELRQQQIEQQNKVQQQEIGQRQQQLQMESVRAADSHILAVKQAHAADLAGEESQGKIDELHREAYDWNLAHGIDPVATLSGSESKDMNTQANAGLSTLAQRNGGAIPGVATTNSAQGVGTDKENHQINVYTVTARDIADKPTQVLNIINAGRDVMGLPRFDDMKSALVNGAVANKANPAGAVAQQAQQAQQFLFSVPAFDPKSSDDPKKSFAAYNQDYTTFTQQVARYEQSTTADPDTLKLLKSKEDAWKSQVDAAQGQFDKVALHEGDIDAKNAGKKSTSETLAKEATPGGQATLAKTSAEAEQAQTQATLNKQALGRVDDFGNKVGLPGDNVKEIQSKQDKFNKAYVEPLAPLVKSDMEFNRILSAGDKMTPAEKVTGLLQAVGISFDPLKGKGARLNNDIIQEHANARDIYQGALQKIDSLRPGGGGPITQKQVQDYASIARGVVHDAYVFNAHEAQRQGLPVDFLPKASKPGEMAPDDVLKIYVDAANGDQQKALAALTKAGFK